MSPGRPVCHEEKAFQSKYRGDEGTDVWDGSKLYFTSSPERIFKVNSDPVFKSAFSSSSDIPQLEIGPTTCDIYFSKDAPENIEEIPENFNGDLRNYFLNVPPSSDCVASNTLGGAAGVECVPHVTSGEGERVEVL